MANPNQLSPGVNFTEIDLSLVAREPASTIVGIAGEYPWGPGNTPILVDTERTFNETFGVPSVNVSNDVTQDYYHAINILRYGDSLLVVRAIGSTDYNAHSGYTALSQNIANADEFDALVGTTADPSTVISNHLFLAKYPGSIGNSLKIVVIDGLTATSNDLLINDYKASLVLDGAVVTGCTAGVVNVTFLNSGGDAFQSNYRFYFVSGPSGSTYQNTIVPATVQNKAALENAVLTNGLVYKLSDADSNPVLSDPLWLVETVPNLAKLPTTTPSAAPTIFFHINAAGDFAYSRMGASGGFILPVSGASVSGITTEGFFLFVNTNSPEYAYVNNSTFDDLDISIPSVSVSTGSPFNSPVAESRAFTKSPGTSPWVAAQGGTNDEVSVAIIDEDGEFTGVKGYVLEVFELLSKANDAKDTAGNNNYWKTVINTRSNYVWAFANLPGSGSMTGPSTTTFGTIQWIPFGASSVFTTSDQLVYSLTGGTQNFLTNDIDLYDNGYISFADIEIDVNLIIDHRADPTLTNALIDLAEARRDVVVCSAVQPTSQSQTVPAATQTMVSARNSIKASSYCALAGGLKFISDPRHSYQATMNHASDLAGLIVSSTEGGEPWFSPAGFNRGQIRNVSGLAYNPTKTYRDELYKNGINPIASFPGQGIVLFGDKTLLVKPSSLDRINVRRLFIILEEALAGVAKYVIGEFNDEFTRSTFRNLVNQFMRSIQSRRGVVDFRVVCDETNNTAQVIDSNQFVADIYVKPTRSINYIQLNFIATRSGVNFTLTE